MCGKCWCFLCLQTSSTSVFTQSFVTFYQMLQKLPPMTFLEAFQRRFPSGPKFSNCRSRNTLGCRLQVPTPLVDGAAKRSQTRYINPAALAVVLRNFCNARCQLSTDIVLFAWNNFSYCCEIYVCSGVNNGGA